MSPGDRPTPEETLAGRILSDPSSFRLMPKKASVSDRVRLGLG